MKNTVCLFFLLFSTFAVSAPEPNIYTQNLANCMIEKATQKEKFILIQTAFLAGAKKISDMEVFENLMSEIISKCPKEITDAENNIPDDWSKDAEETFISTIMLELINNKAVQEAFEKL